MLSKHVIEYWEKFMQDLVRIYFCLLKLLVKHQINLKLGLSYASSLSTYDVYTLYTTLPHNLIKDKLIDLIDRTFQRESSPYLACDDRNTFLLQNS